MAGGLARGVVLSVLALAVVSSILTVPVHAIDDNTVSITVDPSAELKPTGNLYKATANVAVKTGKPYGFNLTMQADTADLLNSKDSTHKISAPQSATPVALGANQWGYSLNKSATTFSAVPADAQATSSSVQSGAQSPATSVTPAVIIDTSVKGKQAGCNCKDHCATTVTFAANIDPAKLASGSYSTAITYTATAKPAPKPPVVEPTVCKSGDPQNDCQVDIDPNMIPVKYTGTTTNAQWTSLSNPEDSSNQGEWYNYNNKQWANALTVKKEALAKYKGQIKVVDQADILGFWVYIPRYAYEVMRRDGADKPVPAQNFLISFEKATTPKRYPAEANCGDGKDYRTECYLNRDYIKGHPSDIGTWATHPAFTFGTKELNGIWFAKFETTGDVKQPTVLPNNLAMTGDSDEINRKVGTFYTLAKTFGVNDPQNVGGIKVSAAQNNHHLAKFSSRMVNNKDWGAAAYLSASKYGAGYNKVKSNSVVYDGDEFYDPKTQPSLPNFRMASVTGCGPLSYIYAGTSKIGTSLACRESAYAYNGVSGQLASTTNNPTGIYDMSGGGLERVAASYSNNLSNSDTNKCFGSNAAHPPYVNTYGIASANSCTFATCGGQALYETSSAGVQWNGDTRDNFVDSSHSWFLRGDAAWFIVDKEKLFTIAATDPVICNNVSGSHGYGSDVTTLRVTLGDFR